MTDYDNYAGVFTCQKLAFAHRQSATIISRKPALDKIYLDKVSKVLESKNLAVLAFLKKIRKKSKVV